MERLPRSRGSLWNFEIKIKEDDWEKVRDASKYNERKCSHKHIELWYEGLIDEISISKYQCES